jgi:hypothetical protein
VAGIRVGNGRDLLVVGVEEVGAFDLSGDVFGEFAYIALL